MLQTYLAYADVGKLLYFKRKCPNATAKIVALRHPTINHLV